MKSKRDLLHELTAQNLSINQRAQAHCQLARRYEDEGDYEGARVAMGELWQRIGDRPMLEGLNEETQGVVLLRVGVLTGWIGSARQISGSQEAAKNLLTESICIFERLQENKNVAEAQIDLACCYWREGAYDEGRVWLRKALSLLTDSDTELKAKGLLRSAIIEADASRPNDALKIHIEAAPLFEQIENHCLRGSFHNELAIVLRRIGTTEDRQDYVDRSLIEYTAAAYHFERAGHLRYQACVENNLAFLFFEAQRYADAHEHLDRADMLFARLKDDVHRAQVDETRARVLIAEDKLVEAEKAARRAVRTLETGDEPSLLTEALITLGISLARLQHFAQSRLALDRAIDTAQRADDAESAGKAALTLIEQLGLQLTNVDLMATLARVEVLLENAKDISVVRRQARGASRVAYLINDLPKCFPSSIDPAGISAKSETLRYYKHLIALALKQSGGAVKTAARLLGMSHQNLSSKLVKYEELGKFRKPIRQRKRSSIDSSKPEGETDAVTILLVEDNPMVAGAIRETLELNEWKIETCADGTAALERISSAAHYDLLLLDYKLPDVDGLQLVKRARQLTHRGQTPIIMFSASPVEAAARDAGVDVFLQKPKDIGTLVETINRLVDKLKDETSQ